MRAPGMRIARMLLAPLLVLIVWEGGVRLGGIDPVYLPPPSTVFRSFGELFVTGALWSHVGASMARVAMGYSLAALLGIGGGLVLGWFRRLSFFVDPLIELSRPVSPISIIPLAILWFGIGETSKVFLIAYATFFPVLLNTIAGVRHTEPLLIRAASALGARPLHILRTVVVPSAAPFVYTGLRVSMGIAMIVVISSEMVAADRGLGWFILDSERVYKTDQMVVGIITISLLSLLIDYALRRIRVVLLPWWRETSG